MLFFFKQKTAYEMRISDWSSDVCSSDLFAQCLVEAGMVGLDGGVAGWLLTLAGLWLVRQQPAAYADLAHLDLPMFLATFALAVAVSLLPGLLPALRASRVAPGPQIKTPGGVCCTSLPSFPHRPPPPPP